MLRYPKIYFHDYYCNTNKTRTNLVEFRIILSYFARLSLSFLFYLHFLVVFKYNILFLLNQIILIPYLPIIFLGSKPTCFIGKISFKFYPWHQAIIKL